MKVFEKFGVALGLFCIVFNFCPEVRAEDLMQAKTTLEQAIIDNDFISPLEKMLNSPKDYSFMPQKGDSENEEDFKKRQGAFLAQVFRAINTDPKSKISEETRYAKIEHASQVLTLRHKAVLSGMKEELERETEVATNHSEEDPCDPKQKGSSGIRGLLQTLARPFISCFLGARSRGTHVTTQFEKRGVSQVPNPSGASSTDSEGNSVNSSLNPNSPSNSAVGLEETTSR